MFITTISYPIRHDLGIKERARYICNRCHRSISFSLPGVPGGWLQMQHNINYQALKGWVFYPSVTCPECKEAH